MRPIRHRHPGSDCDAGVTELESLALLIADLNAQVRKLQQENAELRQQAEQR